MIPISRPSIRRRDMDSVLSCMVTDNLGPGSLAEQLVSAVSTYLGLAGGVAFREHPRALATALSQLGLPAGSKIVMDPLVPHSYDPIVRSQGLEPCYLDISEDGLHIPLDAIQDVVGDGECAVVARSHLGFAPDIDGLAELGIPVIEDISQGIGAHTGDRSLGTVGRFVILGMEPDGIITAGGGTLLLAGSRSDRNSLKRVADQMPAEALLPDLNAALGLIQIKEIENFVQRRAEVASVFTKALMRGRHSAPVQTGEGQNVWFTFPVIVEGSVPEVSTYARKKGIGTDMAFESSVLARFGVRQAPPGSMVVDEVEGDEASVDGGRGDQSVIADAADGPGEAGATTLEVTEFPRAQAMVLRCLRFPLYPSLTSKEVAEIERVLTTLP